MPKSASLGTIHLRRRQIFPNFWPLPSAVFLYYPSANMANFLPFPPKTCWRLKWMVPLLAKYHLTDIGRNVVVLLANPSFLIWHIQAYKDSYNNCSFSRLHIVIKLILYKSRSELSLCSWGSPIELWRAPSKEAMPILFTSDLTIFAGIELWSAYIGQELALCSTKAYSAMLNMFQISSKAVLKYVLRL